MWARRDEEAHSWRERTTAGEGVVEEREGGGDTSRVRDAQIQGARREREGETSRRAPFSLQLSGILPPWVCRDLSPFELALQLRKLRQQRFHLGLLHEARGYGAAGGRGWRRGGVRRQNGPITTQSTPVSGSSQYLLTTGAQTPMCVDAK